MTSRHDSPPSSTASFEQTIRVEASDLDDQDHVNNLVYVRWVLDAATAHWASLTTPEIRADVGWVLLRHEIDYHSPALLGDRVVVHTAVGHLKGLTFERNTTVRHVETSRALVTSKTLWCPVDRRTGRPRRVSAELRALFSVSDGRAP